MNKPVIVCGFKFDSLKEACRIFDLNYQAILQQKSRAKKKGHNKFYIMKTIKVEW